jgi:hypothetical protein
MDDFGVFHDHFIYLVVIWYILLLFFDIFYGYLVYFSRFGMQNQDQSGNPASNSYICDFMKQRLGITQLFFYIFNGRD